MKAKLEAIKKFLSWVFGAEHWKKSCILLAIIIVGAILIFKDCYIKTNKVEIRTDTKLDAEKAIEKTEPLRRDPRPPADFKDHR